MMTPAEYEAFQARNRALLAARHAAPQRRTTAAATGRKPTTPRAVKVINVDGYLAEVAKNTPVRVAPKLRRPGR